ncbi:MAG: tape measure protein, partial [Bacteroidaceae bacterium]
MAGKLSFSIAINLLTENFKKGATFVKNGFRNMQVQVIAFAAALGAGGLGLSNLVSKLIDTARETSRVSTALKNVSGDTATYADSQKYLIGLAKKYGLEINALTGNFAKFTASAKLANMDMSTQKKIFESVSRACTAFGMSADDSNGVFLALSQMMSKGKISSEELRLQMGERLPIALQAMAKAAGVSVGALDKLMKGGKLMSADILPKFAEALNNMIPNVDTNNIETSINKLKNAFTEFTKSTGIGDLYKNIVDTTTKAVSTAGDNIKNIVIGTVAVISGIVINTAVKWWASLSSSAASLEAASLKYNTNLIAATKARIAAEIALEEAKLTSINALGAAKTAATQRINQAEIALSKAAAAEQIELENVKAAELKILDAKKIANAAATAKNLASITRARIAAEIALEEANTAVIKASSTNIIAAKTAQADAEKTLAKKVTAEIAAQEAAKTAAAQAASVKVSSTWAKAFTTIKVGSAKLMISLKSMWNSFAPMIIISALMAIIGKFKALYDESKRIKSIFSDYKKEAANAGNTTETIQLQKQYEIATNLKNNIDVRKSSLNEINRILGTNYSIEDKTLRIQGDLNKKYAERVSLLKAAAEVDYFTRQKLEIEDKIRSKGGELADNAKDAISPNKITGGPIGIKTIWNLVSPFGKFSKMKSESSELKELRKSLIYTDKRLEISTKKATPNYKTGTATGAQTVDEEKGKKTDLQKAEENYAERLKELTNQKANNAIKEQEYNKAVDELNKTTYKEIAGLLSPEKAEANETFKKSKAGVKAPLFDEEKSKSETEIKKVEENYIEEITKLTNQKNNSAINEEEYNKAVDELNIATYKQISELTTPKESSKNEIFNKAKAGVDNPLSSKTYEIEKEYEDSLKRLSNQRNNEVISSEKYNEEVKNLIESTLKSVGSLDGIGKGGKEFVQALKDSRTKLKSSFVIPEESKRDTTFDYKKSNADIIEEKKYSKSKQVDAIKSLAGDDADALTKDIESAKLNIDELKTKYNSIAPELVESLNKEMSNVKSLDEALKIAVVKEDIKNLSEELNKGIYSGIKDIASSAENLASSWSNLTDVMNDVDASAWERIMAIWSSMTSTVDAFMSIIEMIKNLTEITDKLAKAKETEAIIDTTVTTTKIANAGAETAAEATALGAQTAI